MKRIAIAQSTLEILEAGYYASPNGVRVEIQEKLAPCINGTKYYDPDTMGQIQEDVLVTTTPYANTEFEVRNETTLMGAESMAKSEQFSRIGVLNFASAKNPGGGFLKGAQAQEESLARSSALYYSLLQCRNYYNFHRSNHNLLYSDSMIYSPGCPVFRQDDGTLLEQPYIVDFITSPAPNAGAIAKNQPQDSEKIQETLYTRGAKVLSLAAHHHCDALILGAWGCGVFRNQPSMVAQMFADLLLPGGKFWGRFAKVLFSVLDTSKGGEKFAEFYQLFT